MLGLIQDVPDGVIDAVTKISPYDATAYGGLILVLLVFIWIQYKDKQRQAQSLEKVVESLHDIEIHLTAVSDLKMLIMSMMLKSPSDK
jgi:hypothetical protein